jgi:hypothetical protein
MPHVANFRFLQVQEGELPPMKCAHRFLTFAASLFFGTSFCFAQQPPQSAAEKPAEKPKDEKKPPVPEEKVVQTKHSLKIDGKEIKYTATAGTILLKLEDGTPKASIFYMAYTKDDVSDASQRPITFSFNGGPGSASVWLHLGLLGPRRVQMGDAGALLPSIPFRRATAARFPAKRPNNSTESKKTYSPLPISSGSTPRAISAGRHRSFSPAKAMARRAPLGCPVISSSVTVCILMAWC